MTPRGGPTLDFSLFGRYFLDLAVFYPGAFLCLAPLWEHVKAPRRTAVLATTLVTVICLAAAALCAIFELDSNILLLPTLLASFWLLRWRVGPEVSVSQTAFLFAVSGVMTAVCSLLSTVLNARAEVGNDAPACLVSTSLLKLGLSAVLCVIFWFTAVQWSRWLLREYRGEAFWQSAWPLPTIYAAFLVFCMPLDPAVVLINRLMIISVLAVTISLLGIFLLLYEMYQVAREYTRSAQLDRENQLLAVESRRYTELRTYMEQTRHLRHDFRQHLHVIAGLTEAGQVDELKNYLHQYESELSEERPTLCANPAVDALAGHYDHEAHSLGVPVDWRLELPRQLAIPEADFCMMLGNLLENALHASQKLPPEQRQVKVLARMLSPAMLGLLVENRYDGVLKRQQGTLHSTKHDGMGIGLVFWGAAEPLQHYNFPRRFYDRRDRELFVPGEYFIEPLTSPSRLRRATSPIEGRLRGHVIKKGGLHHENDPTQFPQRFRSHTVVLPAGPRRQGRLPSVRPFPRRRHRPAAEASDGKSCGRQPLYGPQRVKHPPRLLQHRLH